MERSSFVFYKDWMEAVRGLPDDVRLDIYESVIEYATTGNVKGLKPMASIAFNFIKTTIDRDIEKYVSIVERNRNNGNNGGRPKKESLKNPNNPVGFLGTQRNPKNLDNDNDNDLNPPLPPLTGGKAVADEKTWRDDFEMYLTDLREAYKAIVIDTAYITERAKYHPGMNIKLSLEKACKEFWATEAGWTHKKKSKSKELNWKSTLTKSLDQKCNQVWLQKGEANETGTQKTIGYV
ncbi:MAG: DUF6291 domain-containing protein [Candidatus Azobacteroides sp.]|nr:DUF6291 domain-containing protein [Candidatus Azobacteroides sp.]